MIIRAYRDLRNKTERGDAAAFLTGKNPELRESLKFWCNLAGLSHVHVRKRAMTIMQEVWK